MHARVVLGVGKGVLFREVSSVQVCPHRERGSLIIVCVLLPGVMLIELKQNEKALDVFTRLLKLHPSDQTISRQVEILTRHIQTHSQTKHQSQTHTQ